MMRKGKGLEFPEGWGGLESASRILMKGSGIREADSDDRGFPLLLTKNCYNFMNFRWIMLIKNA
jgi:hypothetical protein